MMSSLVGCLTLYSFSVSLFMGSLNSFLMWILMEFNLITFIMLMFFLEGKEEESFSYYLFYFLVQSLGSFIFLMGILMEKSDFILFLELILVFSFIVKAGLYPMSTWVYQLGKYMKSNSLFILLSVQKVPLFLFFLSVCQSIIFTILFFSFAYGSLMIVYSYGMVDMLISSSIASSFFILLIYVCSLSFYFVYFFVYTLVIYMVLASELQGPTAFSDLMKFIFSFISFCFFCGLPPLSLFFFKMNLAFFLLQMFGLIEFIIFWIFSFISVTGYYKFFYSGFFFCEYLYHNYNFCKKKMSLLMGGVLFSFVLLT